jgi:peptide/nickel transport system permease protein
MGISSQGWNHHGILPSESTDLKHNLLAEAALSFLGLGTGQSYPSWGQMISLGRDYINVAWWLSTFPGIAILLTVLAINLLGDRVRDVLDPRMT